MSGSKFQLPKAQEIGEGQSQSELKQRSFYSRNPFHLTNLILAVNNKDVYLANRIISVNRSDISKSRDATVALHFAIDHGLIEVAETLLNHNAFVYAANFILGYGGRGGRLVEFKLPSAMERAINSGQDSIIRLILQAEKQNPETKELEKVYDKEKDKSVYADPSQLYEVEEQELILAINEATSIKIFDRIDLGNKEEGVPGKRKFAFGTVPVLGTEKDMIPNWSIGKKQKLSFQEISEFVFQEGEAIDYSYIDTRGDKNKSLLLRFIQKLDGADVEHFYTKNSIKYKVKNREVEAEYVLPSENIQPFLSYKTLFTSDHKGRTPLSAAMERFLSTEDAAEKAGFLDIAVMLYNKMCEYDFIKAKEILKALELEQSGLAKNKVTRLDEGGQEIDKSISEHLIDQANMIFRHRMSESQIDPRFLVGYYSSYEDEYKGVHISKSSLKPKPAPIRQASSEHPRKKEDKDHRTTRRGSDDQRGNSSGEEEKEGSQSHGRKAPTSKERQAEPIRGASSGRSNENKELGGSRKKSQEQPHEDYSSDEEKEARSSRLPLKPKPTPITKPPSFGYSSSSSSSSSPAYKAAPVSTPTTAPAPALPIAGGSRVRSTEVSHTRSLSVQPRGSSDVVRGNLVPVLPAGPAPRLDGLRSIMKPAPSYISQLESQDGPAKGV